MSNTKTTATRPGPVAQLVRALACHARGRGFKSHPGRQYASVAQSVEQGTENPRVGGSIPPGGTIFSMSAKALVEKIIPPSQGIESWLLEICRWHISTSVAFPAGKAIPPGEVTSKGCNFFRKAKTSSPRCKRDVEVQERNLRPKNAAVAHLVERHLAKVEVASSSLVSRSTWYHSQAVRRGTATP